TVATGRRAAARQHRGGVPGSVGGAARATRAARRHPAPAAGRHRPRVDAHPGAGGAGPAGVPPRPPADRGQRSARRRAAPRRAAGLPVVGWRAGNLPHLARDEVDGLVVPTGDVPALAAALARLAGDPALRRRLGDAAARRAASFPTWRETALRLVEELRAVLAE